MLSAAFMSPHYIMIESPVPFIELFSPNKTLTAARKVGFGTTAYGLTITFCSALFPAETHTCAMWIAEALFWNEHIPGPRNPLCLYSILTPPPFLVILRAHTSELGNIPEHMKEHTNSYKGISAIHCGSRLQRWYLQAVCQNKLAKKLLLVNFWIRYIAKQYSFSLANAKPHFIGVNYFQTSRLHHKWTVNRQKNTPRTVAKKQMTSNIQN